MTVAFSDYETRAREFFADCDFQEGLNIVEELSQLRRQDKYRVGLVGGFSRGKTHLLNTLLSTTIFPEKTTPTTTILTEVSYGEPNLTLVSSSGETEIPLTEESLDRFTADGPQADMPGMLSVRLSDPLLLPATVIYDTPGIDDILEERASLSFLILDACDCALMPVSAISPLGLHEKAFIQEHLQGRGTPHMAVVLTFLDKLPEKSLERQLEFITASVRRLSPAIEVWSLHDLGAMTHKYCKAAGAQAMRERLKQWSQDAGIQKRRDLRDGRRLRAVVEQALGRQQALLANMQGDIAARQEELSQAYAALDKDHDVWRRLSADFQHRGSAAELSVATVLQELSQSLQQAVQTERPDEFCLALRPRVEQKAEEIFAVLKANLERDVDSLVREIRERFKVDSAVSFDMEKGQVSDDYFKNIALQKNNDDLASMLESAWPVLETIIMRVPLPLPVKKIAALIMTVIGGLMGPLKKWLFDKTEENRATLAAAIPGLCLKLEEEFRKSVRQAYALVGEYVRTAQRDWIQQQKEALQQSAGSMQLEELQQKVAAMKSAVEKGTKLAEELRGVEG